MSYLLEPLTTGKLPLKNRLVMPPMATSKAEPDGRVSEALLGYYDEKSRGGAIGLVIIEHNYITKQGKNRAGQPSVADDSMIDGLSRLAEIIHRNGSKTALQINHVGGTAEPCRHRARGRVPVGGAEPRRLSRSDAPRAHG